jgi:hypothetical protein
MWLYIKLCPRNQNWQDDRSSAGSLPRLTEPLTVLVNGGARLSSKSVYPTCRIAQRKVASAGIFACGVFVPSRKVCVKLYQRNYIFSILKRITKVQDFRFGSISPDSSMHTTAKQRLVKKNSILFYP